MADSCLYYKPIVNQTDKQDSFALKMSFLSGDGLCPVCKREGKEVKIEERLGDTTCERDGTYAVCIDNNGVMKHGTSLD